MVKKDWLVAEIMVIEVFYTHLRISILNLVIKIFSITLVKFEIHKIGSSLLPLTTCLKKEIM
jgi:hypothetical protein